ncbi:hypothetical protein [Candidatus Flexifilum breve]|uniref:hypothetical protein n=1 Tax=Candidatus Flexifilum breve TaxID=3140694 RepID=UPI003312FD6A
MSGDVSCVVMRLLTGETSEDRMRRGEHLSLTEIATLLGQITAALEYTRTAQAGHRDIKLTTSCSTGAATPIWSFPASPSCSNRRRC